MSMDAVEFINERKRMCKAGKNDCSNCPLNKKVSGSCSVWCFAHPQEVVPIVEQWAREHPRPTRQSEFLKQYPDVKLDSDGVIDIAPCQMEPKRYPAGAGGCESASCIDCRHEFWAREAD